MSYKYKSGTNQLDHVKDAVPASNYSIDIDNQDTLNYRYDQIGNLTKDRAEGIDTILWTVYGKIQHIKKTNGTIINYNYDASGNRISKTVVSGLSSVSQFYLRDATGDVMSIYTKNDTINNGKLTQSEVPIYGSSRLGIYNADKDVSNPTLVSYNDTMLAFTRGKKLYELTDHRGNVMVVVNDKKIPGDTYQDLPSPKDPSPPIIILNYLPEVVNAQDSYSFGMEMPNRKFSLGNNYRYGYNGKENDKDGGEGVQDYGMRIYDSRLGRFLSVDPIGNEYPWNSTYAFAENDPINFIDLDGLEKPPFQAATEIKKLVAPLIKVINQAMDFLFPKPISKPTFKNGFIQSGEITQHRIYQLEKKQPLKEAKYIILHRTVSSNTNSSLTSFKTGVGTHFLVGKDGQILQTASLYNSTSHLRESGKAGVFDKTPSAPHNINSIGIEVVGMPIDKDGKPTLVSKDIIGWEALTPKQTKAVGSLVKMLKNEFKITNDRIKTHEGIQPKTKGEGQTVKDAIKDQL